MKWLPDIDSVVADDLRAWLESLRLALGAQRASLWVLTPEADGLRVVLTMPPGATVRPAEVPKRGHALGWVASEGVSMRASRADIFKGSAPGWVVAAPVSESGGERVGCLVLELDGVPRLDAPRALELGAGLAGRLLSGVRSAEAQAREYAKNRALFGTVEDFDHQLDLGQLAAGLSRRALRVTGGRGSVVASWEAAAGTGEILAVGGEAARTLVGARLGGDSSFLGLALHNSTSLPQDDLTRERGFPLYVKGIDVRAGSAIIEPIVVGAETVGAVAVEYERPRGYAEGDLERLRFLAGFVAAPFRNALTFGEVEAMSLTDALTGLPNRRSCERALASVITVAERTAGEARSGRGPGGSRGRGGGGAFAVAVADIDHFKRFNDRYGHDAGDLVLKAVAGVIRDRLRPGDHAGRWGGEEFLIVLPGASLQDAAGVLERIRRGVESMEVEWDGQTLGVTLSAGLSAYPEVIRNASAAVSSADAALYKAKRSGRNAVALAEPRG